MSKITSFYYFYNSRAKVLDVILQGGSYGIDSPLMQKIFKTSVEKGNSTIMFNFPYFERGEDHSSGPELKEELKTLKQMLTIANAKNYKHIRLIGKSLGAIVASYYLDSLSRKEQKRFEIIILGFVAGQIKLKDFVGKITIIQGEKDRFGGIGIVRKAMGEAVSKDITYYEIPNADHSYRNPDTKKPLYEDRLISILSGL